MEFTFFIGTDVSKNELDFAVMQGRQLLFHREISNNVKVINLFLKELVKLPGFNVATAVFCMEHTGIYSNHLLLCLHKMKANICLESASQIKSSLGNIRGKNDKIDAIRIGEYAYKNREELRLWTPKREAVVKLSKLSSTRSRLIAARKMLSTAAKENDEFLDKRTAGENRRLCACTINAIDTDLKKTEDAIDKLVDADPELKRLFSLITSVSGIGKITAAQIVIATNDLKILMKPKSLRITLVWHLLQKNLGCIEARQRYPRWLIRK